MNRRLTLRPCAFARKLFQEYKNRLCTENPPTRSVQAHRHLAQLPSRRGRGERREDRRHAPANAAVRDELADSLLHSEARCAYELLTPTDNVTGWAYKAFAEYWSVDAGGERFKDLAWCSRLRRLTTPLDPPATGLQDDRYLSR